MIEIKNETEKVILVGVSLSDQDDTKESLEELKDLVSTAGAETVGMVIQNREQQHPGTYVGKGKIEELKSMIWELRATGIVCDDELSPAQMKNLQDELDVKVMDRTLIILDIFAARASTSEGKIQVELAQLKYQQTRLAGFGKAVKALLRKLMEENAMLINSNEYLHILESIKQEIRTAQYRAAVSVNRELLLLYHSIGEVINAHKTWGSKFVENLAADIKLSFPDATGYSVRNLKYMAKFAAAYPGDEFVQQAVAQIPWGHNVVLMDKLSKSEERLWYAERSAENGWSRNVLVHQIESGLYQRQVLAEKVSNFGNRLPSPQSELAAQTMKDPYIFDFIPFKADMVERDIEQALVKDVTKLLLELGTGFAFLGNQYHLNVGGDDFYIDLLFYNLNLRCYVVIELKTGEFKPEYAGQLNFYLSAVDGILKKEQDNPSIGLLLCKSKNNLVAEYSLKDMSKPIGVSAYQITSSLPEELERQLPSVEDIQKRIKGLKE